MRLSLILLVVLLVVWGCEDDGPSGSPRGPSSMYRTPLAYDRDSCIEWQLANQASLTLTAVAQPVVIEETPAPAPCP